MDLVDEQKAAAIFDKCVGRFIEAVIGKVHVVCRYVKRVRKRVFVADALQEEGGLARTARANEAKHPILPPDGGVEIAMEVVGRRCKQASHVLKKLVHELPFKRTEIVRL